jgi:hypothetical protein
MGQLRVARGPCVYNMPLSSDRTENPDHGLRGRQHTLFFRHSPRCSRHPVAPESQGQCTCQMTRYSAPMLLHDGCHPSAIADYRRFLDNKIDMYYNSTNRELGNWLHLGKNTQRISTSANGSSAFTHLYEKRLPRNSLEQPCSKDQVGPVRVRYALPTGRFSTSSEPGGSARQSLPCLEK